MNKAANRPEGKNEYLRFDCRIISYIGGGRDNAVVSLLPETMKS
jgi:hypothetical protein